MPNEESEDTELDHLPRMKKRHMRLLPITDFDLDMLRALQCAYYCHTISIVTDQVYDEMEKSYRLVNGDPPIGSDLTTDYTPAQRALCLYFLFSGRFTKTLPGNHLL